MASDLACIDTQILYWVLVKKPPLSRPDAVDKALNLFRWMHEKKFQVIIPTLVVGEVLVSVPLAKHSEVLKQFERDWMVVEFDLRAASEFAKLRQRYLSDNSPRELQQMLNGEPKRVIIADMMILGVAIANKADYLVTDDNPLLATACGIQVLGTGSVPYQALLMP